MPTSVPGIRVAIFALAGSLAFAATVSAQQLLPPPTRSPAIAPRPATTASPRLAGSSRAAACHNGASFERFLAELKQRAVAEGVSQQAISEASPYLVYDQGIGPRERCGVSPDARLALLHAVVCRHPTGELPHAAGPGAHQDLRRSVHAGREGIW